MKGRGRTVKCGLALILAAVCSGISLNSANAGHQQFAQMQQGRTLAEFEPKLDKSLTPKMAEERFGKPERITGSGLTIYIYFLDDNREIWMGFPG